MTILSTAVSSAALIKGVALSKINFDSFVKAAAEKVTEADVRIAKAGVETQVEGRDWHMNQALNMIAYEDQN
ncbi:hypothetical protein [Burkholderia sp. L27(2015)]|jgi:hypothetical protein|uniref:hypothetical protein n=1 Tax=Burkholderia sp. L27(2015) TaxID=1641858 RepID=UPI00131DDB4B|nr:hypothetical protein [Burkholderia sp. L27(2015)]